MVDVDLLVHELKKYGHTVEGVNGVPENAGDYEFFIDGEQYSLEGARELLEADQATYAETSPDIA